MEETSDGDESRLFARTIYGLASAGHRFLRYVWDALFEHNDLVQPYDSTGRSSDNTCKQRSTSNPNSPRLSLIFLQLYVFNLL